MQAAVLTKGCSEPSGVDADGCRRILIPGLFGKSSSDIHKAFKNFIKKIYSEELQSTQSLEAFTANRLILLNKNPGLRPIGVAGVLRRIVRKVFIML